MPPLSAEQIADRNGPNGFLGASEIASVVGENPWSGPIDVWLRKTGREERREEEPKARVGQRAESLIVDWYVEDTGLMRSQLVAGESVRHRDVECAGCTPDFLVYGPEANPHYTQRSGQSEPRLLHAVQVKCVGPRVALMWPDDWVPSYVECQVQFEAEILGVPRVDVAAWLGGTDWRIIPVERDREFGAMLLEAARDFWRCVREDVPPPVDGSESWRRYLARRFPKPERQELDEPSAEVDLWAQKALEARDDERAAVMRKEHADNRLRMLIGDGSGYLGGDYVVTWLPDKNGKRSLRIKRREFKGGH